MANPLINKTWEIAASARDIYRLTLAEDRTRRAGRSAVWQGFELVGAAYFLWLAWTSYFSWSNPYLAASNVFFAAYIGIPGLRFRLMCFVAHHATFWLCGISEIRTRISITGLDHHRGPDNES